MKYSKKIFYFCMIFLLLPIIGKASDTEVVGTVSEININKDRTANIKESYEVYFINNSNNFERKLDKKLLISRKKGNNIKIDTIISDINTDLKYETRETNKYEIVDLALKGKKDTIEETSLSYKYNLGQDKSSKYDEFYYNIISNFNSVVSDVTFEIVLPKDAKIEDISFALNNKYNLTEDDVSYYIEDNVITGYLNIMLNENDTFSVRIELPNNYFVGATNNFNYLTYLFLLLPLITLVIAILFWLKYGKGNKANNQYSYYPPNNFDPVEVAYLYKGMVDEQDLTSLTLFLANNGYLKIEENDDGYKLGKENSFKFIKEKEYDKRNAGQKILYDGIFKDRQLSELNDIEYTVFDKILDAKKVIDNKDNRKKIFNININRAKIITIILIIINTLLLNIIPVKEIGLSYLLVPVVSFVILIGLAVMMLFNIKGIIRIIIGLIFILGTLYLNVGVLLNQKQLLFIYLMGMILIFIIAFIYNLLPLRTKFGNEKLGEVYGFRQALLNMNKDKLLGLLNENSNYFYDMVPYAYGFGILDDWINKGKNIIVSRPKWHISKEEFDLKKESKFFKNVIYTTAQVMIKGIYAKKESSNLEFKRDQINEKLNEY